MFRLSRTILDVVGESSTSATAHPLRTALSILAIATAVATITVVVTGLQGFQTYAKLTSARTFGSDAFVLAQIIPGQLNRGELAFKLERNPVVRRSDVRFVEKYSGDEVILSPIAQNRATWWRVTASTKALR